MKLIGLTGPAGSGKDTVARFLCETQGFVQVAFADSMRDGLKAMFGLTDEDLLSRAKKEVMIPWLEVSPRELMQGLGTWGRDGIDADIWITVVARKVAQLRHVAPNVPYLHIHGIVVSDIRFENEAAWLREQRGELWHIHRTTMANTDLASNTRLHASEQGVAWHPSDRIIYNSGSIDDLCDCVAELFSTPEETSWQTTCKTTNS